MRDTVLYNVETALGFKELPEDLQPALRGMVLEVRRVADSRGVKPADVLEEVLTPELIETYEHMGVSF